MSYFSIYQGDRVRVHGVTGIVIDSDVDMEEMPCGCCYEAVLWYVTLVDDESKKHTFSLAPFNAEIELLSKKGA